MSFLWIYNAVFPLLTAAWNASLFSSTVKILLRQVILYSTCFFPLNIQRIFSGVRALFSAQAYLLIEGDFIWSTSVKLMELRSAKISELEEKWEYDSTRLNVSDLHSKNFSHPLYFILFVVICCHQTWLFVPEYTRNAIWLRRVCLSELYNLTALLG